MLSSLLLVTQLALAAAPAASIADDPSDSTAPTLAPAAPGPRVAPAGVVPLRQALPLGPVRADTTPQRAIEYSDWYGRRLTIHRWGSYAMIPLFVAQYALGDKLTKARDRGERASSSTRNLHSIAAGGVAALFGINTITGAWNMWDARHDPNGRTLRTIHGITMLVADAGFVATGALAEDAGEDEGNEGGEDERGSNTHRNVAVASMGVSVLGTVIMWFGQR